MESRKINNANQHQTQPIQQDSNLLGPQITQFWGNWISVIGEVLNAIGQTQQLEIDAQTAPKNAVDPHSTEQLYAEIENLQHQINQLKVELDYLFKEISKR